MGTPKISSTLLHERALTKEDWRSLIEARKEAILPLLSSLTLTTLGEAFEMATSGATILVGHTAKELLDADTARMATSYLFKSRGFFDCGDLTWPRNDQPGTIRIWGLDRQGYWVLAKALLYRSEKVQSYRVPRVDEYKRVSLALVIKAVNEGNFLQRPAEYRVYHMLGVAVEAWAKRRRKLYEEIEAVRVAFEYESDIVFKHFMKER